MAGGRRQEVRQLKIEVNIIDREGAFRFWIGLGSG